MLDVEHKAINMLDVEYKAINMLDVEHKNLRSVMTFSVRGVSREKKSF